ncbi:transporter substrate-binding domain-containing protein [Shewanella sp. SG44-2]|uniref:diguanylate cyclase domain-containing protein n=1 Tax=Shewanella sp. SG44-2 TaxID=2760962 RepID=UPI001602397D|nr:transporter substrate-binding domain-containing protein [Shewanella sp. SG44-2]MBB1424987.1 transporter substrate-binding domain-containing protein [Shewanella sp. SG44-2]
MKFIPWILAMLFAWISLPAQAIHSDKTELSVDHVPLVIVMGEDTYPFEYLDEKGSPAGILVDLWREWSIITDTKVQFVSRHWQQSLDQLEQKKADIHIGMSQNQARLKKFDFAKPFTSLNTYLYIHKSLSSKKQISDLVPYQVGIVSGSSHEATLLALEPKLSFKRYQNREQLLQAAVKGELFVFAGIEGYQRNLALEQDIAANFYSSSRILIKKINLAPAVVKGDLDLLNKINQGFELIPAKVIQQIERRWLGYHRQTTGVIIAMQNGVEPYADIGADGLPHGMLVDLWTLWSEKTGINIDLVAGDMSSTIDDVKRGVADVHIGYPESQDMRTGLKQAWHIISVKSRFFSSNLTLNNIEDIAMRIGVYPTAPYISDIKKAFPKAQLRFYDSLDAMVKAARNDEISGFVSSAAMTSHYLLANKLWAEFRQYTDIEFSTDMYVLTRIDDSGLADRIQAGFNLISVEEQVQVERKWLINPDDRFFANSANKIKLTTQQKQYVSSLGAIKMGYLKNWAPMEFQGKNGEFLGVNADIKNLLVKQLNLTIIPVAYDDFGNMMNDLIKGEIHLVASMAKTVERENTLAFSLAYWPSPWAIVTSLSQPPIFNISQVTGKRLAVVDGYHIVDQLRQQYPGIKLVPVADTKQGMEAVITGSADMFVEQVATLATTLKGGQYPSLKMSLLAELTEQHSHIGLFPGVKNLVPLIDRVIATIDETEQQNMYQKWVSLDLNSDTLRYQRWLKILVIGLLIITLIAIVILMSNRRLNVEIQKRLKAEENLRFMANHDNLTALPNRSLLDDRLAQATLTHHRDKSKFALLFIDLDGFKAINDQYGHHVGDKLLQRIALLLGKHVRESDTVARFGGDEFVVLLNHIEAKENARQVAENILLGLKKPLLIDDINVSISASIGIAIFPNDADTAASLLKKSDQLMYQAKKVGGHQYKMS